MGRCSRNKSSKSRRAKSSLHVHTAKRVRLCIRYAHFCHMPSHVTHAKPRFIADGLRACYVIHRNVGKVYDLQHVQRSRRDIVITADTKYRLFLFIRRRNLAPRDILVAWNSSSYYFALASTRPASGRSKFLFSISVLVNACAKPTYISRLRINASYKKKSIEINGVSRLLRIDRGFLRVYRKFKVANCAKYTQYVKVYKICKVEKMCTTYGEDGASNRIVVCNGEKFGNLKDRKRVCRRFSKTKVKNSPMML